jgi:hypothetical protein
MDAAPVLNYLGKADQPTFSALGPVSMLKAFALSVGRSFIKGHSLDTSAFGRYLLYTTARAEGPVLRSKRLLTGLNFQ